MNVWEKAEALLRRLLGKRRNRENCVRLGLWLLRQHGPYEGRVFPVPRYELAADERFARQCGLTYSQIRTAAEALLEVGLLKRISPERQERRRKDPPTQYEIGTRFALLFPVATNREPKVQDRAPLFVATWKNPIPRPVRPVTSAKPLLPRGTIAAPARQEVARALARLEAQKLRPLPMLSQAALMAITGQRSQPGIARPSQRQSGGR